MTPTDLRALQAPLKNRYRDEPASALVTSRAEGRLVPGDVRIDVETGKVAAEVGLHVATGGDGTRRCSAEMILEALVGCAGVTFHAVATSMGVNVRSGRVRAEGDWDARGKLGVSRDVPVGLTAVRLWFEIDSDATTEQLQKLAQTAERYCVIAQSIATPVPLVVSIGPRL
jgi:uncharacterized OsmC-like protein